LRQRSWVCGCGSLRSVTVEIVGCFICILCWMMISWAGADNDCYCLPIVDNMVDMAVRVASRASAKTLSEHEESEFIVKPKGL